MSRVNFGAMPYSCMQPVWVICAYGDSGSVDAMVAAWCGISEEEEVFICISPEHKTTHYILESQAFTISMANALNVKVCDYLGVISANDDKNKWEKSGLTIVKSEKVNAPIINECPICIECRVKSYDQNSCILKGKIVNVSADESVMTEGRVDMKKARPICFDPFNNVYHEIGNRVGNAFFDGNNFG